MIRAALALGAAMRATRLVVRDDLPGQWLIKDPLDRLIAKDWARRLDEHAAARAYKVTTVEETWAHGQLRQSSTHARSDAEPDMPHWYKIRDGLDCPFCVGLWIAGLVVLTEAASRGTRWERAWTMGAATLTLNEVAAHLGARLGDVAED